MTYLDFHTARRFWHNKHIPRRFVNIVQLSIQTCAILSNVYRQPTELAGGKFVGAFDSLT